MTSAGRWEGIRARLAATTLLAVGIALRADVALGEGGASDQQLFHIARSVNRNVVVFEVRVTRQGALVPVEPIRAYWRMYAEDGHRESLTWLERQVAYGFATERAGDGVILRLSAFSRRAIHVRRSGERFQAEVSIAGSPSRLERIWVEVAPGLVGPVVRHVVLEGTDLGTGARRTERIKA